MVLYLKKSKLKKLRLKVKTAPLILCIAKKDNLKEIANLASQYQPKGFTLNTVEVKIKQPFLVKGQLRYNKDWKNKWLESINKLD